jgi:hypothetical protein
MDEDQRRHELAFVLPLPGFPLASFRTSFGYDGGALVLDGATVLAARTRAELERGVQTSLAGGATIAVRVVAAGRGPDLEVTVNGRPALRRDRLRARPSPSAWIHACLALAGSAAGFVASFLYLQKATVLQDEWAFKMGTHMAGWHLLLTCTLFPASVWGQRTGIRAVQLASALFFLIHAGIALANLGPAEPASASDRWIAALNAASGLLFLATALYGSRAYRDMDPVQALRRGRAAGRGVAPRRAGSA